MADVDSKNEVLEHEWVTLQTLWDQYGSPAITPDLQTELQGYFKGQRRTSENGGWNDLNRAEQIVGTYMDAGRLKFEYEHLLALAESRRLPSLVTFKVYEERHFGPGGTPYDQRVAYLSLLYSLQSNFVEERFARALRKGTAKRLLATGVAMIFVVLLLHTSASASGGVVDPVTLLIVAAMGAIGAFFSRVATFQTNFSTLRISDITDSYQKWVLAVRLVYGCIGAIVFCYLMRSGLLSSSVFPDAQFWERPHATPLTADGSLGKLTVIGEWSKLLVWSFIAGFSERLVSSSLDKIGSK